MASGTVVYCNILWFYIYFLDTEASHACFRLLDDDGGEILADRTWTAVHSRVRTPLIVRCRHFLGINHSAQTNRATGRLGPARPCPASALLFISLRTIDHRRLADWIGGFVIIQLWTTRCRRCAALGVANDPVEHSGGSLNTTRDISGEFLVFAATLIHPRSLITPPSFTFAFTFYARQHIML